MKRVFGFGIAIIALSTIAACGGPYSLNSTEQAMAENGARQWAERTQAKFVGCSGQDSDNDNYVSCTVQNAQNVQEEVLCAYKGTVGCKRKTATPAART